MSESFVRSGRSACPSSHSLVNKIMRMIWGVISLIFFSPSIVTFQVPRVALLRLFGAKIGRGVQVMPSVKIWAPWNLEIGDYSTISHDVDLYSVDRIIIGSNVTISQRAFICTASHEIDHPNMPLMTAPIIIKDGAWVCAGVYIHHGVTIGVDAVAGVRSVVLKDVPAREVVGGNPAEKIRIRRVCV